jgi:hypothetical protein
MTHMSVLGIDIAKQLFHVVGLDDTGTVVWRKRFRWGALMPFITQVATYKQLILWAKTNRKTFNSKPSAVTA